MREQTDDEVISAITALRGFGLWSAEIYLMFSLRRRDVFPAGDLALRSSLGILKDLEGKLTPKQAREPVEHWSPWHSVGSLFLWHYHRGAPNCMNVTIFVQVLSDFSNHAPYSHQFLYEVEYPFVNRAKKPRDV